MGSSCELESINVKDVKQYQKLDYQSKKNILRKLTELAESVHIAKEFHQEKSEESTQLVSKRTKIKKRIHDCQVKFNQNEKELKK